MSYLTEVLTDSPALLLRLGEPSGTTAEDSTTNNRDGTIAGTPTLGAAGPCDDGTTAMLFDGADDWVDLTDGADIDATGDFSIECFFKSGTQVDADGKLFFKHAGGSGYGLSIVLTTGLLTFETETGTVTTSLSTSGDYADGQWHHVVCTRSGANGSIYVDGTLVAGPTALTSANLANTAALRLGAKDTGTRRFVGTVANVAFYNTALSAARIAAHYAARVTTTTLAYDALLTSVAPAFVVLVEPQPMEPLHVWTAAGGGLTNTWYCDFASQIAIDVVAGGLYRRLDVVRQNATDLVARASAALVDANLGSYFHETTTSRIYVSTTTGSSPEVFALIGAWFTLFFSTDSVSFTDQPLFAPLVTGTLPSVVSEKPDLVFGAIVADQGEVSLLNGDGLFDRLSRRYVWRNKIVTFKLGGVGLGYSDFVTVDTMRVNAAAVDDEVCTLQLESLGSVLNQSLPAKTWAEDHYVGVGGFLVLDHPEVLRPLLFGTAGHCPLAASIAAVHHYATVSELDHPNFVTVNSVIAIDRVSLNTIVLVNGVDYQVLVTTTAGKRRQTIQILDPVTYSPDVYEIRAELTDPDGTTTTGAFAVRLLTLCGVDASQIDAAAFAAVDAALPTVTLGFFVTEATPAVDLLRRLEQSVMGTVYVGTDGRWTMRLFDPSLPADWTLTDADFASWAPLDDLSSVLNEVRVQYHEDTLPWLPSTTSSSDDTVLYTSETYDSHTVPTFLRNESDAALMATRLRFLKSAVPTRIAFEERGLTLMAAQIGDPVAVTRARAPHARLGRYDGHLLQLVKLEKQLGPDVPVVRGVLDDLGGRTEQIARCVDDAVDLDWVDALPAEQSVYGFCADANGYVDPADTLTREAKVVW